MFDKLLDTGETFGIIPSEETTTHVISEDFDLILLGDNGSKAEMSDNEDSDSDINPSNEKSAGKGDAAAWLAMMEGTKTMAKKIAGEHEKKKFWDEYKNYHAIGEHGIRDWTSMAIAWNVFVAEREKRNENNVVKFYRKHAHMLESFFDSGGKSNNIKATLQPHQSSIDRLTKEHRSPVTALSSALDAFCPHATHGPNSTLLYNADFSNMVPIVPLHMSYATVLTNQSNGPIVYPGQTEQSLTQNTKKRQLDRAPQICGICGHFRQHNIMHNDKHGIQNGTKCSVHKDAYNIDRLCYGWCPCQECTEGAFKVGYPKPDIIAKQIRALKTCKKCGHYKDYGHYSIDHSNTDCRVHEENYTSEKYKGYCSCQQCLSTALNSGKDKHPKLRKRYK